MTREQDISIISQARQLLGQANSLKKSAELALERNRPFTSVIVASLLQQSESKINEANRLLGKSVED